MLTTARFADRMPATYSVRIGPSCQNTSPICVAMPIGPETGGARRWVRGERSDERAEPVEDQAERADRLASADADGRRQVSPV